MSFLKRYFLTVLQKDAANSAGTESFDALSEEALEAHLRIARYGNFVLTDAIRPSYDVKIQPQQGYRRDVYRDAEEGSSIPVLMASASREILFDLFDESLDCLGDEVDVVLETSHFQQRGRHRDLYREHIDLPVLKSLLWDHEDLLLNDGCTGIAVINPHVPLEIQLDEHKLLIFYGEDQDPFERVLEAHGVDCRQGMRFLTEAEHVHSSTEEFWDQFEVLRTRLGMDSFEN